ncbi:hypothetical protein [Arthrobacter sp. ZGTC412]|uniref:hypothetical protein n=1 Tax=Arthrobacter sp. ZGTC412 TaxID=2058900 RepID=UPI000CE50889|nr:hypothetical protein [Arthrobacter sp. ZGTC412]
MNTCPTPAELQDGVISQLQDLVLETSDAEEFFQELAAFSATLLAPPASESSAMSPSIGGRSPSR